MKNFKSYRSIQKSVTDLRTHRESKPSVPSGFTGRGKNKWPLSGALQYPKYHKYNKHKEATVSQNLLPDDGSFDKGLLRPQTNQNDCKEREVGRELSVVDDMKSVPFLDPSRDPTTRVHNVQDHTPQ